MDICVFFPTFWLLWIMLLSQIVYTYLWGHMFNFLWYISIVAITGLYDNSTLVYLMNYKLFSKALFYIPTSSAWSFWLLHIFSSPSYYLYFFIIVILMGITWYLLILIGIFLMDNVKCLFYAHWPLVYFLCINVYSNTLSIFNWVFAFYCWAVRVNLCVQIHFPIKYVICKYFVSVFSLLFHTFNRAFMKGQVFLIWWNLAVCNFVVVACNFGGITKKLLPNPRLQFAAMFSSKRYIHLDFIVKSIRYLELILYQHMAPGRGPFASFPCRYRK